MLPPSVALPETPPAEPRPSHVLRDHHSLPTLPGLVETVRGPTSRDCPWPFSRRTPSGRVVGAHEEVAAATALRPFLGSADATLVAGRVVHAADIAWMS